MTIDNLIAQAIKYLRQAVLITLLALLAVYILRTFGVSLPIRAPGHIELAYLAGAFWLLK